MSRFSALLLALLLLVAPQFASAKVSLAFYSFNGSTIFPGGYPHAYIKLEGTLEKTGAKVFEIYGFTTKGRPGLSILQEKTVHGEIHGVLPRYVKGKKNEQHFILQISDAQYRRVLSEVNSWRSTDYNLKTRSCLHFVAAIARLVGIDTPMPDRL